ncbi:hypothetical protein QBC36DRAFT_304015 [Triangularia setosa]|uniref:Uncharacterized protein n=1 Tax=Triangularia setosa TaxID=2587417 RepID=A0AAN6W075_9PEZI|nr:hypothetical protein QBC36DRAFT_304015 [Podospora setosa]
MRHIRALLPLSLASLGAAEIIGQWTAWTLTRTCFSDSSSCTYHLALDQNPQAKTDLSSCVWTVVSINPFKPANQTDFANVQCGEKLSLNGGWSNEGFYTIVPTDTVANAYAFFGFTDEEIQNGKVAKPRQRPAYRVGSFSEGEHPDLGLGMLKKMKMGKRSPVIALKPNQQQDDSSTHKMDDTTKMEKKQNTLDKQTMLLHTEEQQQQDSSSSSSDIDSCTRNCPDDGNRYDMLSCFKTCHEEILGAKTNLKVEPYYMAAADKVQSQPQQTIHSREHLDALAAAASHSEHHNKNKDHTMADDVSQQTWQIRSLTRLTNYNLNLTLYTFSILSITPEKANTPPVTLANCAIDIPSASPTNSWYGQRCDITDRNVKYTVGWGYKLDTDSAVMTVCHPGTGMAWFGWDGVTVGVGGGQKNKGEKDGREEVVFGDSKRERIHEMICT